MEIRINPAEQRVVVKPDKQGETRTNSGIIIPSTVDDKRPELATVIAVGSGSKEEPMKYWKGQRVIYSQYAGLELKLNLEGEGEATYKIMNQMDIIGVIEEL